MFYCSFVFFLLLAPLYKAGNRPLPLMLLELAAVGFLFVIVGVHRQPLSLPRTLWIAIGLLLGYPLVQLLPLPVSLWSALPGHAEYATVLEKFAATGVAGVWRAISIIPSATEAGWLALLPPLACLLAVLRLGSSQVARLLLLMAVFAGLEGFLGLMQVGAGGDSIFYLRNSQAYGTAVGTFVNRNHLAAMLAMMLPVIVGLLVFGMRPGRGRRHRKKLRLLAAGSEVLAQRGLLFASAVMILLCLIFTRSRAGIATTVIGLAFSSIVLVKVRVSTEGRSANTYANWIVLALVVVAVMLAVAIGLAPVLERMEPEQLTLNAEGRLAIYAATVRAAIEFLPFGSGLSTFADVFPQFQIGGFGGYVDHAHNDYLQAFMELGLAAPIAIALLLAAYASRIVELLRREGGRSFDLLQIAAAVGMLPMILHSLFDFALHMPANALWFATLAGVMFHPGVAGREPAPEGHRRHRSSVPQAAVAAPPEAVDSEELAQIVEGLPPPGAGRRGGA